ncbi:FecCD family ABC transporter permease [Corynebacterium uterequi]|uniref:ABC-type Fe3+-siderophore transport system, permease component n=1 Tax=Corynebacterium uterequi TaxID=1072256 RepID=A0A0G3HBU5_9CORY|nr:iron ABC transporter permease [Corynebacterium uterequi]AKK10155.1 ABC-type Fe3+-siderophore transport system, permease component [Corynebacterium uterequi]
MADSAPQLGLGAARRRAWALGGVLIVTMIVTMFVGILFGSVTVDPSEVIAILRNQLLPGGAADAGGTNTAVIWEIRTPRVVLGAFAGAGLAVAGLIMQALVRNMLADPYVVGINSGASCGAAGAILFGFGAMFGDYALQTSAFLGALAASVLIFVVARAGGTLTSVRLLMAGVAVGYALSALTSFLIFASDSAEGSRSVMFWLLGSLGLAAFNGPLLVVAVVVCIVILLAARWASKLDALALGDDTALTLGMNPERFRAVALVVTCLLIGVIVAMVGSIGFVGLVVPHLARRLVGGVHRYSIPISALLGAVLLLWADLGARTLMSPEEIPIGIITALVGAPFLLILVRRMYSGHNH